MNELVGLVVIKLLQVGVAVIAWWGVLRILDKLNHFNFKVWWNNEDLTNDARASYLSWRMLAVAIIFAFGG